MNHLGQSETKQENYYKCSHGVEGSGEWQGLDCNKEHRAVPHLACSNTTRSGLGGVTGAGLTFTAVWVLLSGYSTLLLPSVNIFHRNLRMLLLINLCRHLEESYRNFP